MSEKTLVSGESRAEPIIGAASTHSNHRFTLPVMDLLLILAMSIWATHYSIAKAAIDTVPPFVYNALRFGLAAAVTGVLLKASGGPFAIPRREIPHIIAISLALHGGYQALFMYGLKNTTVAHSVLISSTVPAGLVLVNILTGRERGSKRIYSGIVMALVGVTVVILSRYADELSFGLDTTLLGDLLTTASVFLNIGITLAMRGPLTRNHVMAISFWLLVCGTIVGSTLAIPDALRFDWSLFTPQIALALFYSACIAIVLAGTIWNSALKRIGTSRTAVYMNLQPIVAAAVAILLLGEPFTLWLVIGTALVLVGMWRIRLG